MALLIVGTNPVLLLNPNSKRRRLVIQMQPQSVDSNNTGRIHIERGRQPVATVGDNSQGEILIQTATIDEPTESKKISPRDQDAIWATASAANQSVVVTEELDA